MLSITLWLVAVVVTFTVAQTVEATRLKEAKRAEEKQKHSDEEWAKWELVIGTGKISREVALETFNNRDQIRGFFQRENESIDAYTKRVEQVKKVLGIQY